MLAPSKELKWTRAKPAYMPNNGAARTAITLVPGIEKETKLQDREQIEG